MAYQNIHDLWSIGISFSTTCQAQQHWPRNLLAWHGSVWVPHAYKKGKPFAKSTIFETVEITKAPQIVRAFAVLLREQIATQWLQFGPASSTASSAPDASGTLTCYARKQVFWPARIAQNFSPSLLQYTVHIYLVQLKCFVGRWVVIYFFQIELRVRLWK